jgi:hypothetical protein
MTRVQGEAYSDYQILFSKKEKRRNRDPHESRATSAYWTAVVA